MNIIFMGTPDFALNILKVLCKHHNVKCIVTQPDKPVGRGKKIKFSPVKQFSLDNNIKLFQPQNVKDEHFIQDLKNLEAEIFVVAAYGKILPIEILNIPKYCINVHGSLLPKYRGAAPIQWSLINGEVKTGITIMRMDIGMDTGDIILKEEIKINDDYNFGYLYNELSNIGATLLIKALDLICKNEVIFEKQNDDEVSYAPMITKKIQKINWNDKSINIINLVRAMNPSPGAFTIYNNLILKIFECKILDDININYKVGEIFSCNNDFCVKTLDGTLVIKELQFQNSKKMKTQEYLKGNKLNLGTILI